MLTPAPDSRPRLTALLVAALLLFAAARGVAMLLATPLVALANNYDQVRYTACLDLFAHRPGQAVDAPSYTAPLQVYSFQPTPGAGCYLTSDLLFQGSAVALYRAAEALDRGPLHSVRTLGALRLGAWLLLASLLCLAFWREGAPAAALANAAWLALLGLDPLNALYLNTFYAEAGALFFAYALVALAALCALRTTPRRLIALAAAALLLGTSKIQHLALPLCIAAALGLSSLRVTALRRPALALVCGGLAALLLQSAQMQRDVPMFRQIALVNAVNLVLSATLPASSDAAATAQRLGLDAHCAASSGKSIYQLQQPAEQACPGIDRFRRSRYAQLLAEPATLARMLASIPPQLLPAIPDYLGKVAGADNAPLPAAWGSVDRVLTRLPLLIWPLLLLPLALWLLSLLRPRALTPALTAAVATTTAVALAVPVVSLFGDGKVELARHAHLATNAALAFVLIALVATIAAMRRRKA